MRLSESKKKTRQDKTTRVAAKGREKGDEKLSLMNNILARKRWLINFQQEGQSTLSLPSHLPACLPPLPLEKTCALSEKHENIFLPATESVPQLASRRPFRKRRRRQSCYHSKHRLKGYEVRKKGKKPLWTAAASAGSKHSQRKRLWRWAEEGKIKLRQNRWWLLVSACLTNREK